MMTEEKKTLRRRARQELARIPREELHQASLAMAERLIGLEAWRRAGVILAFNSMPAEIETSTIIARALSEGKRVGLPRIAGRNLEFREWSGGNLERGPLGILEPSADSPLITGEAREGPAPAPPPALLVTPGLAFGRDGSRLGRAGGFYDRYLTAAREGLLAVGVCLDRFLFDSVPTDAHDQPVDAVITETRTIVTRAL